MNLLNAICLRTVIALVATVLMSVDSIEATFCGYETVTTETTVRSCEVIWVPNSEWQIDCTEESVTYQDLQEKDCPDGAPGPICPVCCFPPSCGSSPPPDFPETPPQSNPYDADDDGSTDCLWWIHGVDVPPFAPNENDRLGERHCQDVGGASQCGMNTVRPCHSGVDVDCDPGQGVRAMHGGQVVQVGIAPDFSHFVQVRIGPGLFATYGRVEEYSAEVAANQWISPGQVLAYCGDTGPGVGAFHTHYRIESEDPDAAHGCEGSTEEQSPDATGFRLLNPELEHDGCP